MSCTPTIKSDLLSTDTCPDQRQCFHALRASHELVPKLRPHRSGLTAVAFAMGPCGWWLLVGWSQVPLLIVRGNHEERRLSCNKKSSVKTMKIVTAYKFTTLAEAIPDETCSGIKLQCSGHLCCAIFPIPPTFLNHSPSPASQQNRLVDQTPWDDKRSAVFTSAFPGHAVGSE